MAIGKISQCILKKVHGSLHAINHGTAYFDRIASYENPLL